MAPSSVLDDTPGNPLGHTSTTLTGARVNTFDSLAASQTLFTAIRTQVENKSGPVPTEVWNGYIADYQAIVQATEALEKRAQKAQEQPKQATAFDEYFKLYEEGINHPGGRIDVEAVADTWRYAKQTTYK